MRPNLSFLSFIGVGWSNLACSFWFVAWAFGTHPRGLSPLGP